MQVLCIATSESDDFYDVQCPSCKQKYSVYYSRQDAAERAEALEAVIATLLAHHALSASPTVHPQEPFTVPHWSGPAHASAAALLSGAPIRRVLPGPTRTLTLVARQQRLVS